MIKPVAQPYQDVSRSEARALLAGGANNSNQSPYGRALVVARTRCRRRARHAKSPVSCYLIGPPGRVTRDVMQTAFASALDRIRALLDSRTDVTDWRLPTERDLGLQTGAGRRAVRRALDVLEAEGRIWRHQGKGTFAGQRAPVRPQFLSALAAGRTGPLEVMEARLEIEPGLARLAAAKASADTVAGLHHILRRLAASTDDGSLERWDGAFHRLIAETAGNRLLLAIFEMIDGIRSSPTWRHPRALARTADRLRVTQAQHAAIVAAIARHDGAEAERAMRRHLTILQSNLQAALLGQGAEPAVRPTAVPTNGTGDGPNST